LKQEGDAMRWKCVRGIVFAVVVGAMAMPVIAQDTDQVPKPPGEVVVAKKRVPSADDG